MLIPFFGLLIHLWCKQHDDDANFGGKHHFETSPVEPIMTWLNDVQHKRELREAELWNKSS
jgi:hypothetical protein